MTAKTTRVEQLAQDPQARDEAYKALASITQELQDNIRLATQEPEDVSVEGWLIKRIVVPVIDVEIRLCECTKPGIPYTVPNQMAEDVMLKVLRGHLHVAYEDLDCDLDLKPGQFVYLPAHIARTTFAAEFPTTLFALFYGKPETRARDYASANGLFG